MVGLKAKRLVVAGEAKWTTKALAYDVLEDLLSFKLPAMQQAGFTLPDALPILLASRNGFTSQVQAAGNNDARIRMLPADDLLEQVR